VFFRRQAIDAIHRAAADDSDGVIVGGVVHDNHTVDFGRHARSADAAPIDAE
jgi:hypothetical protein